MRHLCLLALGGLMLAGGSPAFAADPAAGRQVANMCRTCHGLDGYAQIPIAPHIGGEPLDYLEAQLTAFKDGTREHEMMSIVARGLSETQIADVSAWYAAHEVTATLPEGVAAEDAPEDCVACHGADGLSLVPDAPNLAGEVNIYIDTQLKAFRTGKRTHEIMTDIAADLTDAEIRAYADWYAAVTLEIAPAP
ncbi:c-type cytochrome [Jannaschia sp. KMU-145]|uniref:c-type cytochrome n=1 Tax=Jannaschia halovivens TaxID=3388667 RepID=UPI00396B121C